eukprot:CFRG4354T1
MTRDDLNVCEHDTSVPGKRENLYLKTKARNTRSRSSSVTDAASQTKSISRQVTSTFSKSIISGVKESAKYTKKSANAPQSRKLQHRNFSMAVSVHSASNSTLVRFPGQIEDTSRKEGEVDTLKIDHLEKFRSSLQRQQARLILSWNKLQHADRRKLVQSMVRLQAIESTMKVELKLNPDEKMEERLRICHEYVLLHENFIEQLALGSKKYRKSLKSLESTPSAITIPTHKNSVDVSYAVDPRTASGTEIAAVPTTPNQDKRHVPRTRLRHTISLPTKDAMDTFLT